MKKFLAILTILGCVQAQADSLVATQFFNCDIAFQGGPAGRAQIKREVFKGNNKILEDVEIVFDSTAAAVIANKYGRANYIRGGYARQVFHKITAGLNIPELEKSSYAGITNLRYVGEVNSRTSITTDVTAQFQLRAQDQISLLFKAVDRGLTADQKRDALKANPDLSESALSPHGVALTGICSANQN